MSKTVGEKRKVGRPGRGTTSVSFRFPTPLALRLKLAADKEKPQRAIVEELLEERLPPLPGGVQRLIGKGGQDA